MRVLGLRTVIYKVPDLARAKTWYAQAFDVQPYFDEPYYVGFNIGGFELGLDPDTNDISPGRGGVLPYWGVSDIDAALAEFQKTGATIISAVQDVGGDIKVATVADPFGNPIGLIQNPHFVYGGA